MPSIVINMNLPEKKFPTACGLNFRWSFFFVAITLIFNASTHAELKPLQEMEMASVYGRSGVIIAPKNIQIFNHIDSIYFISNADQNSPDESYLKIQDFSMHGTGDVARFNYDFGSVTKSGMMFLDVAEPEVAPPARDWSTYSAGPSGTIHRGMLFLRVPEWDQELGYRGLISLFDSNYDPFGTGAAAVELGAFDIGLIDKPRFNTYISPSTDGYGVEWQHDFQMTIDHITYAYNKAFDKIEFSPIYIGGTFSDLAGDDPRNPATWKPNQATAVDFGDFQIGDLFGDASTYSNPAGMDVGEADFDGAGPGDVLGALNLRLPMQGSLRFESASFDGVDFGPGAIDGLHAYRLSTYLIP